MIRPWPEISDVIKERIADATKALKTERDADEIPRLQSTIAALEWVLEQSTAQPKAPESDEPAHSGY